MRRSRRAGAQSDEQLIRQIHKQVTDKGQQGLLSRARQALESHGLRPSNEETLGELKALHQAAFVPPACGRHARLRQQLDAAKKRHGFIKLSQNDVWAAVNQMPRSTATWTPVIFMRCATRSLQGLRTLTWVLQSLRNGEVPDAVKPLVLELPFRCSRCGDEQAGLAVHAAGRPGRRCRG